MAGGSHIDQRLPGEALHASPSLSDLPQLQMLQVPLSLYVALISPSHHGMNGPPSLTRPPAPAIPPGRVPSCAPPLPRPVPSTGPSYTVCYIHAHREPISTPS